MSRLVRLLILFAVWTAAFGAGAVKVQALINFGGGYYVNLCGSGTSATSYSCDPGCSVQTGSCQSNNQGVVKWLCSGKWDQCLESESGWSNFEDVDSPGCGKTVQVSLFDKKCRMQDGGWDESCRLLGYMVWYSGDCWVGGSPTPTRVPAVTLTPTVTPRPQVTGTPTATPGSKFGSPTPTGKVSLTPTKIPGVGSICGKSCSKGSDCEAGFTCADGVCRNPSCPSDASCFCGDVKGAIADKNPQTGWGEWFLLLAAAVIGPAGWKLYQMAKNEV
ncbi:hypothetical protein A3H89_03430 [Candidatus Amesbacteria bacterium RIFCSPLOWO2_02_FULL_48_11]|uniref:Uncharacterized protein n=2 Tax=Candidatus Amesiibacteriota TaxID=1752730 RepID=A0A0G1UHS8_9BACT|nr:MAG: hypothetical protein UY22_C0018G0024 [Candidatus Amesbacteria bacterium GW2011_GWC1_48_10]KKU99829.1 MAG: hypothetical protein UY33_C0021G0009 [Candidatus Amesbacteria bacterium GW2011_GWA1_48_9]OGC89140.1 MAG: hypothetical protein A2V48_00670 [Candidatus Amesbacteria bacterium RBG_19FT_COMBO_48_16]OGC96621.1 MAG: hypothetical protein A3C34_00760 [Candidatus Amesbacteria bacterium RIFCSPHIGHO2_02_FULL_48_21]OGC98135.1 MAG: hypothetical protein A2W16_00365 [Candidatus Amesbacteria bacter